MASPADAAKKKTAAGVIMLTLAAVIWGAAFSAQSVASEHIGPYSFNSMRFLLGAATLLPVILISDRRAARRGRCARVDRRKLLAGGSLCGTALFLACYFQQCGIARTGAGKAGFITSLYIVLVPLLSLVFLKKRAGLPVWAGVGVALCGMYLLCAWEGGAASAGDLYLLAAAAGFSVHILIIDRYSPHVDCLRMSCLQFFVAGVLALIPMLAVERPAPADVLAAWQPIAYVGVCSCGMGYTFQMLGQRDVPAPVASLLMSLESVFSALFAALLLHDFLQPRELLGSALMLTAVLVVQLWRPRRACAQPPR